MVGNLGKYFAVLLKRTGALMLTSALTLGALSACAHPPPNLSTQGRVAFTADQIVLRVNELEDVAIQANAGGGLPVAVTRALVNFAVAADQTLKATPAGWQATVSAAWTATKRQLPTITNPAVAAAISAVDVALVSLGGN